VNGLARSQREQPVDPTVFVNDDMETVAGAFQEAFKTVLAQYLNEEQLVAVKTFVTKVVVEEKPWMWSSPEGVEHLLDLVMVDELIRDFVMTLAFTFFARWGEASVKFTGLTDALSWGTSADNDNGDDRQLVLMPDVINSRLTQQADVKKYLAANKWVVTLLLIKLFVIPPGPDEPPARKKQPTITGFQQQ
jgi:hypothetical protein